MNGRRGFLALTASAVVAGTVLPAMARQAPDPWIARNELERRLLLVIRDMTDAEQVAFLRGMQRQLAGVPMLEAMRGVYVELGRPVPASLEIGV